MALSPEDYIEIQQLYARYSFAIDMRDFDGYKECYSRDAVFVSYAGTVVEGHEALRAFGVAAMENPEMKGYHWNGNVIIDPAEGGATGKCYLMYVGAPDDATVEMRRALYYTDELVQEDGRWVFSRREVHKQ